MAFVRQPPEIGSPQDHEIGVDRQLGDLLAVSLPGRDHGEVPAVELAAKGPHRILNGIGVGGGPLGQGGVAGVVHADES